MVGGKVNFQAGVAKTSSASPLYNSAIQITFHLTTTLITLLYFFFFNEPLFKECSWIGNESVNHTSFNYFLTSDRSWSIPTIARA